VSTLSAGFGGRARAPKAGIAKGALLVVDDETSIVESIADLFQRRYTVYTASNAADAYASVMDHDVSVVISDQRMPQETGAEFLSRVAQYNPSITRILLTGFADIGAVIQAVNSGQIYYYLAKPWSNEELHLVVDKAFEHNGLLRERDQLIEQLRAANTGLEGQVAERTRELQARTEELEKSNRFISELARKDPLTGLSNRRHLDEVFAMEVDRSARHELSLSVIMVDVDHFKKINDTYGHAVGDKVLIGVANILELGKRTYDMTARFGGEEFVVLLPDTRGEEAVVVAERLRTKLQEATIDGFTGTVTASFGVASLIAGEASSGLFAKADAALYRAKEKGRNRVEF
jgi:diguanylate cyclase (GGDEF)-like protein